MPGVASLRKQQYYGYKQNHFWKLVYSLFNLSPEQDYASKIAFLRKKRIALWDVLKCCEREGSLDSNIRNPETNDFEWLFKTYPGIHHIYFNGATAESYFKKKIIPYLDSFPSKMSRLPSSSPANTMPFDKKLEEWKVILNEL